MSPTALIENLNVGYLLIIRPEHEILEELFVEDRVWAVSRKRVDFIKLIYSTGDMKHLKSIFRCLHILEREMSLSGEV